MYAFAGTKSAKKEPHGNRNINTESGPEQTPRGRTLSDRTNLGRLHPRTTRDLGRTRNPPHAPASRTRLPGVSRRLPPDRPARRQTAEPHRSQRPPAAEDWLA